MSRLPCFIIGKVEEAASNPYFLFLPSNSGLGLIRSGTEYFGLDIHYLKPSVSASIPYGRQIKDREEPDPRHEGSGFLGFTSYIILTNPGGIPMGMQSLARYVTSALSTLALLAAAPPLHGQALGPLAGNPWVGLTAKDHKSAQDVDNLIQQIPLLAAKGVNVFIYEVDYSFEYQSHPEVKYGYCVTKAQARQLADACRRHGVKLIPLFNCFGHQSIEDDGPTFPMLLKHPEYDETAGLFPNNKGVGDWHYETSYSGVKAGEYPSIPYFMGKGFRVWPCGFNNVTAIKTMIDFTAKQPPDRMLGYLASVWESTANSNLSKWEPITAGLAYYGNGDVTPPSAVVQNPPQSSGGPAVQLSWQYPSDVQSGVVGYEIYRDTAANPTRLLKKLAYNLPGYVDSTVVVPNKYHYRIKAVNRKGLLSAEYSNETVVTAGSVAIRRTGLPSKAGPTAALRSKSILINGRTIQESAKISKAGK